MMKPAWIVLGILGAIGLVVVGSLIGTVSAYNDLVHESEDIDAGSAEVDVQYQRGFALVPQMQALAEQYLKEETKLLTDVSALRSGLAVAENGSYEQKDAYMAQSQEVFAQINTRLEAYPSLGSLNLFLAVIDEMEATQNQIAVAKLRYNEDVRAYNAHRRECCLPAIVAGMFGFDKAEYIGYDDRPNQTPFPG